MLQSSTSTLVPGHSLPPLDGSGLLQDLVRNLVPSSHVLVQAVQDFQSPQTPSLGATKFNDIVLIIPNNEYLFESQII